MAPPPSCDAVEYPAKANKSHRMSYTVVVILNLLRLSDWVHLHMHELLIMAATAKEPTCKLVHHTMRLSVIANQEIHDLPIYGNTRLTVVYCTHDERHRAATHNDCKARAVSRRQPCRGKPAPHTFADANRQTAACRGGHTYCSSMP